VCVAAVTNGARASTPKLKAQLLSLTFSLSRQGLADVVRAALNIYASEGLRQTSLDACGHA
jgi:hypothetical protein